MTRIPGVAFQAMGLVMLVTFVVLFVTEDREPSLALLGAAMLLMGFGEAATVRAVLENVLQDPKKPPDPPEPLPPPERPLNGGA